MARKYWGYRIDTNHIDFFRSELEKGNLRQGWGGAPHQNLRMNPTGGARRNLPIFNKVKKGDLLLIPRLPTKNEVAIVEATEDFKIGYRFDIDQKRRDYGHIFPAKLVKQFTRSNENIAGNIRATLKNVSRFWNIDHCATEIEALIKLNDSELRDKISYATKFINTINDSFRSSFNPNAFSNEIFEKLSLGFSNEEWEYALVEGLRKLFPEPIVVERTGGPSEVEHGTDILIKIPGLLKYQYCIAIQIKDYRGIVSDNPIKQLSKADKYWNNENTKLIDKILIITKSCKEENSKLLERPEDDIRIIFADDLKELLNQIGLSYIGIGED